MSITIDAEFQSLIPALPAEELAQLEANLLADGCRDPLVVWQGENILIDGHNRYAICQKYGLVFQVVERPFADRNEAIAWMIRNQFGRRNISVYERGRLAGKLKDIIAAKAKEHQQIAGGDRKSEGAKSLFQNSGKAIHTDKELAKDAGVSHDTIYKVDRIESKAPAFIKEAARAGDLSTDRAYKLTKALEGASAEVLDTAAAYAGDSVDKVNILKRLYASQGKAGSNGTFEEVATNGGFHYGDDLQDWLDFQEATVEEVSAALKSLEKYHRTINKEAAQAAVIERAQLPEAKYRVIYADPPYAYDNTMPDYFTEQADHYPLLSIEAIRAIPISEMVEDNAVLFLWVMSPILPEGLDIIRAWGFVYKSSFVWDKIKHVMGHYNSVRHEFLLIGVRGSCQPEVQRLFDSVVSVERTRHSEKPEQFRQIIDTLYPSGKRLELFARKVSEGWDTYGNEIS